MLSNALGYDLPGTLVFDYPNILAIAAFIATLPTSSSSEPRDKNEPVGLSEPPRLRSPTSTTIEDALRKVQDVLRAVLGQDVGAEQPLAEAGVDSLAAIEIRDELAR